MSADCPAMHTLDQEFHCFAFFSDGDGEINEEEFLRIMKKTSLY